MDFRLFSGARSFVRPSALLAASITLLGLSAGGRVCFGGVPTAPLDPAPLAVRDARFGWDFAYAVVIPKPSGEPRVTIHYQTTGDGPLAEQTARLVTRVMDLHKRHFGLETRFFQDADSADVWLAVQRPVTQNDGGETRQNQMYIFAVHDARRSQLEWTRTIVHEWGHLTLPAARGFTDPENDASGYLGERLYLKWLHDDAQASASSNGDGTTPADLKRYYDRQVAPLMARFNRPAPDGGPSAMVLLEKNTDAMDGYIGAVCASDAAWGSQTTGRAVFGILGTKPQDFFLSCRAVWLTALERKDGVPLKLPAWVPLPKGAYRFTTGAGEQKTISVPQPMWRWFPGTGAATLSRLGKS